VEIFPTYSFQLTPYNQKKIRKYLHWTLGANVGSDHHLLVAEIQLQTTAIKKNVTIMIKWYETCKNWFPGNSPRRIHHQNNSSPAQFTVAQFTAGTIHRGTIYQAKFTAQFIVARFPVHNSPRINLHEKIKNPAR
jgi:hypothetical protein